MTVPLHETLPPALADALGQIIAQARREWMQELEVLKAERRALIAEIRLAALGKAPADPDSAAPVPTKPTKPKVGA